VFLSFAQCICIELGSHTLYDMIYLQLGDPTAYGNIPPCPAIIKAITQTIQTPSMAAGYANACGTPEARAAIARHHSSLMEKKNKVADADVEDGDALAHQDVSPDDVIVAGGASGALELALTALLDEDSVLLGKYLMLDVSYISNAL